VDTITLGDRFINRRREELIYPLSSCLQEFSQLTEQISLLIDSPRIPGVTTSYVFRTFGRREGKEQRQLQEKGQNTAQQLLRKKEQQELTVAERRRTFEIYISAEEQKRVTRVCKNFTFDPFYREDNGQEILIDIFKYICSYDPERPIRSWVYKVAVNKLSDLHLRNNRIKYSADREMEEFEDKAEYVVKEFELSLAKPSLYSNSIQKCLYQLKPVLRDTFLLKEAGFKIREIAAIHYKEGQLLTNNMETVKSRLYCARKKMKEFLINEGY